MGTAEVCRFLAALGSAVDALDVFIEYDEDNDTNSEEDKNKSFSCKNPSGNQKSGTIGNWKREKN